MSGIKSSCAATEEMIFSVGGRTTVHLHSAQHGSFKRWPSQPISWLGAEHPAFSTNHL